MEEFKTTSIREPPKNQEIVKTRTFLKGWCHGFRTLLAKYVSWHIDVTGYIRDREYIRVKAYTSSSKNSHVYIDTRWQIALFSP
jgi:hypothetical protein